MPPVLRLVGRLFGRSATARLAAENALRYPERSSRMAIGVVMGVTLVTMFAVAIESTKAVMTAAAGGELPRELGAVLDSFAAIMMGLVAVSAVIAGVGLVNLLTLGVVQRRRELGPAARARRLERAGAPHGAARGGAHHDRRDGHGPRARASSTAGRARSRCSGRSRPTPTPPSAATFVWPAVPLWPVVAIVVATAVLTLVAAVVPTRLATRSRRSRRSPSSRRDRSAAPHGSGRRSRYSTVPGPAAGRTIRTSRIGSPHWSSSFTAPSHEAVADVERPCPRVVLEIQRDAGLADRGIQQCLSGSRAVVRGEE